MPRPVLLAAGGAHIDRRGRVGGLFVPAASNPGTLREDVGGGALNALRHAVRRGVDGAILSVRGADAVGEAVAAAIAVAGIRDLAATFLDRASPSYTALIDRDGGLIAGLADMALYDAAFAKQVRRRGFRDAAGAADALLLDANMPEAALVKAAAVNPAAPVFAIAVSPAKALRLKPLLGRLAGLFMNAREARALAGLGPEAGPADVVGALRAAGLARGVVTDGGAPVFAFDADDTFTVDPPAPRALVDETGAGDALCGTAIAALMRGSVFREAVREGLAAALLTVESAEAAPRYTAGAFKAALALVPAPSKMA